MALHPARKLQLREANRRYYVNRRRRLIEQLGGMCVICWRDRQTVVTEEGIVVSGNGDGQPTNFKVQIAKLTFDHKFADRDWCMRANGQLQRLKLVESEVAEGRIQVLCVSCNSRKQGRSDDLGRELRGETTVPF